MGNRSQYAIGATISAIAVVLSLVAIVPAVLETPTQTTALNALGHVTITAVSPDGNVIAYRQGDNFVTNAALNDIQLQLFEGGGTNADFRWLALCGNAGVTARDDVGCAGEMSQVRANGDTGSAATSATKSGAAAGTTSNVLAKTITIQTADQDKTFNELGLFDATTGGNMFSTATFGTITVPLGTLVGMTYTITIGGG